MAARHLTDVRVKSNSSVNAGIDRIQQGLADNRGRDDVQKETLINDIYALRYLCSADTFKVRQYFVYGLYVVSGLQ